MINKFNFKSILIVISSPSGAGKTSLANAIVEENKNIYFSTSVTTRPPRDGEENGREYIFTNKNKFDEMIINGEFIEYAEVFGNYYGTPKGKTEEFLINGKDIIFDVDWQGGTKIRNSYLAPSVVSIFILPPSIKTLQERLLNRNKDDDKTVKLRMKEARSEISHWSEYDYILVNDNFEKVKKNIIKIIEIEKIKRNRQNILPDFISKLNTEFDDFINNT
jgi:guanylate kinase